MNWGKHNTNDFYNALANKIKDIEDKTKNKFKLEINDKNLDISELISKADVKIKEIIKQFEYTLRSYEEKLEESLLERIGNFLTNINLDDVRKVDDRINIDIVTRRLNDSKKRIRYEVESLNKKSNINLTMGTSIGILAIVLLAFTFEKSLTNSADLSSFLISFIPRLSLIIIVEIFSFFFLRLYRGNMATIKYYQNELTNIELKEISLISALTVDKSEIRQEIISLLGKTERNFKLNKDESTIEIATQRMNNEQDKNLVADLIEIMKNYKQN